MRRRDEENAAVCAVSAVMLTAILYLISSNGPALARLWANYSPLALEVRKVRALERIAEQGR